jgi:ElaB/YqjD/DUF883 family membrane-anchored ribosome-binding protein
MITDQIAEERLSPPRSEQGQARITQVRSRVTDLEEHARTLIRQRPVVAVLAAVGVGYLVARLVSRAIR